MRRICLIILIGTFSSPLAAQQELVKFRISGGGGQSSAGSFELTGTIGQAEADVLHLCSADGNTPGFCSGATWELSGGFWQGVQPTEPLGDLVFRNGFEA